MDPIAEWSAARHRVVELVTAASVDDLAATVPACPGWTVRDLLSHVIGLDVDVVGGDEPDDHNSVWTQAHVDSRAGRGVEELLQEWDRVDEPLRRWMREHGARPLGDVIIHEQDLRGALGVPGARDTPGLAAIRDRMAGRFADAVAGLGPIVLRGETWQWTSEAGGDGATVVEASDFDLARALMSRRSAAQLRSWTSRGDIEPFLAAFAGLGPLPEADLSD